MRTLYFFFDFATLNRSADHRAWALLRRLTRWLDQFKDCFGHRAQHVSLRQYVQGLLSDSPRKSMQAMLARVVEPTTYQAFQHFLTHAPWSARAVWRRLLAILPERCGVLILDETSFPKQGRHSVGVARQYCGAVGKIANCQVAVTAALWTGLRAWPVGAELYLSDVWATDAERRRAARVPPSAEFQEKWRLGLTLLRRARAAGLQITGVVGDAEYGEPSAFRRAVDRLRLPYALGIRKTATVFVGTPHLMEGPPSPPRGRPRKGHAWRRASARSPWARSRRNCPPPAGDVSAGATAPIRSWLRNSSTCV